MLPGEALNCFVAVQEIKAKAEKSTKEEKEDEAAEPVPASPPPAPLVRMAYLSVIGGHTVNGVAEIHSEIVKDDVSTQLSAMHSFLSEFLSKRDHTVNEPHLGCS